MTRWAAQMVCLALFILASAVLAGKVNQRDVVAVEVGNAAADWFMAYQVAQPPSEKRGPAMAMPVFFEDQAGIDNLCGGKNQVIACAHVGGGAMALPNPCQARFAGEAFAAVACHEKGHILGWRHDE